MGSGFWGLELWWHPKVQVYWVFRTFFWVWVVGFLGSLGFWFYEFGTGISGSFLRILGFGLQACG